MGVSEFLSNALKRPNYLLPVAAVVLVLDVVAMVTTSSPTRVATGPNRNGNSQVGVSPGESLAPEVVASASAAAAAARGAAAKKSTAKSPVGSTVAVSDTEVAVGFGYISDAGSTNNAAGFGSISQVDQKKAIDMIVAEVNKAKPGGRKIVPVVYKTTESEVTSKGDQLEEEACQFFTKDNKVFMTWNTILGTNVLHACLNKQKVAEVGGGGSSKTFQTYPYLVDPTNAALDRMAGFYIEQLFNQGYFSGFKQNTPPYQPLPPADGKPQIGLIRYDTPEYDDAATVLKQHLSAHGLALCSGCEFKIGYSASDVGAMLDDAGEVQAAINNCKNRTGGAPPCTHMLFLGSQAGGRIALFYADGAEKQAYRARLGLNANDLPDAVIDFYKGQGVPDSANPGPPQYRDGILVSTDPARLWMDAPEFPKCKKLYQSYGGSFEGDDGGANAENQIPTYCDTLWYGVAALNAIGKSLSLQTWVNGVEHIAPVPSASTFLMQTKVGRHDGAGAIRVGKWDDAEVRFKPVTGDIPV